MPKELKLTFWKGHRLRLWRLSAGWSWNITNGSCLGPSIAANKSCLMRGSEHLCIASTIIKGCFVACGKRMNKVPYVLHIVPALFDKNRGAIGGAERYVYELARHMADVVPTELLTFGDKNCEETVGKLRIRIAGNPWYVRGRRFNPVSTAIFSAVRRADVVHCHQQHTLASSLAALACRLSRRRVFTTDLGGGGLDISSYVSTDRLYHGHLHISEYSRQVFGHQGKARAHVTLGGVDTEKFSPTAECPRDGSVLFVGR